MSLAEHLEGRFRGDTRFRGSEYLKTELVRVTAVTPSSLTAVIEDEGEFETELLHSDDGLQLLCSCSRRDDRQATCRHLWAAILVVDRDGFLAGSPGPDYVPPFAGDGGSSGADWRAPLLEDMAEGDDDFAEYLSRSGGRRTWETRIGELDEVLQRLPGGQESDRRIVYEIDLAQSRSEGQLVLQTSQQERRTNGRWGKWKPLRIRGGRVSDIRDADDRELITLLAGGIPTEPTTGSRATPTAPSTYRYRVPDALAVILLPRLCDTKRLVYSDPDGPDETGLTWDNGPAWDFRVTLDEDSDASLWRLTGLFHRGEEECQLSDTRLVLAGGLYFTNTSVHRHTGTVAAAWSTVLDGDLPFAVPNGDQEDLVTRLLDLPELPDLKLPDALALEEIDVAPTPVLQLTVPRGRRWQRERLSATLHFDYAGELLSAQNTQSAILLKEQRRCARRNSDRETDAWRELEDAGFEQTAEHRRGLKQLEIPISQLTPAIRTLTANDWRVQSEGMPVHQAGELQMKVRSHIDWFELHGDVDFSGQRVRFPELLAALARGESAIRLDDGSLGLLPDEWANQYAMINQLGVVEDEHVRFAPAQVALLDALLASKSTVDVDEKFEEIRNRLESFDGISEASQPDDFQGALRTYQREGLGWLHFLEEFQFGGCLADDMGLGKTVQVLAALSERANGPKPPPSLVVVPRSLVFNWKEECERFCPELKVLEYSGLDRASLRESFDEFNVILTTYGTLRRDILELKDQRFDYVVLDEAQTIKNAGSQIAKASRLLEANHRLALSGTPIENHLGDLWSIFEFLNPGMLGRSSLFRRFTTEDNDNRHLLTRGLSPFILRRTKSEVAAELPERFEQTIQCRMGDEQQRLYDEMRDHYRQSLLGAFQESGGNPSRMHVLEALLRLRQIACHPGLLNPDLVDGHSAKLDTLNPLLKELIGEGHKALVFSQFTSMLAIVKTMLDRQGIPYEYLDGQTRDRKERIEHFQADPDCGIFLISLKAGGLGLNLTAADYVFLLDPWWNPAVEMQAIDRAHRVGQTRPVFAYRLICEGTVEEKIADLQQQKRELADAILLENRSILRNLTRDDLELLFS